MKTLLIATSAAALMSASALAQLGGVTGQVRGQLDTTLDTQLDDTLDLDTDLDLDSDARVDTRSGLRVNTRLVTDLETHLRSFSRADADARLGTELQANATAYVPAPRTPSVHGRSAYSSTATRSRMGTDYAEIRVYSRDGYYIGNVERFRASGDGAIWVEPVNASGRQSLALSPDQAWFDAQAHAVVTDMTRAQFDAAAMAG